MRICNTCEREFDNQKKGYRYCPDCRDWRNCKECGKRFKYSYSNRRRVCSSCTHVKYKRPCVDCGKPVFHGSNRCNKCHNLEHFENGGMYTSGYKLVKQHGHPRAWKNGYVYEHILVMEQKLKRSLVPGENVHHKNGIRHDNRPDNLELWIRPQPTGIRATDAVAWAQEVLELYAPELLNGCNSEPTDNGIRTRESVPSRSTRDSLH